MTFLKLPFLSMILRTSSISGAVSLSKSSMITNIFRPISVITFCNRSFSSVLAKTSIASIVLLNHPFPSMHLNDFTYLSTICQDPVW